MEVSLYMWVLAEFISHFLNFFDDWKGGRRIHKATRTHTSLPTIPKSCTSAHLPHKNSFKIEQLLEVLLISSKRKQKTIYDIMDQDVLATHSFSGQQPIVRFLCQNAELSPTGILMGLYKIRLDWRVEEKMAYNDMWTAVPPFISDCFSIPYYKIIRPVCIP